MGVLWQAVKTLMKFYQGLHCLLRLKQHSGTEICLHHNLETSTCDPLKYKMGNPILNTSICM